MKITRFFSSALLLALLMLGGSAVAQCYQPTMSAARQAERDGNYGKAADLYHEAQGCYDASPQQKETAKKQLTACCKKAEEQRQREEAERKAESQRQQAERSKREEAERKAEAQRKRAEAERKAEARRQKEKEDELRRREEQLRQREEQIRQQEQQAAEQRQREEAERKAEEQRQQAANRSNETIRVNGVEFTMVWVAGGTFTMGATSEQGNGAWDREKPAHSVTLSGYYIGETEVTQALWKAVMGNTFPSYFNKKEFKNHGIGDNYPAFHVNYKDVQAFISKLNALTGRTFRLPTEAEWEYAARGGCKSQGYKYAGSNNLDDVAWYWRNSGDKYLGGNWVWKHDKSFKTVRKNKCRLHPVGQKRANELGLYDMSGNVCEWCSDWYDYDYYSSSPQTNPKGPITGTERVVRGGECDLHEDDCRVSYRKGYTPYSNYGIDNGFRLVLCP